MAGEDLLEGDDGGTNDTSSSAKGSKKKHKPLSKGQKIGVAIGLITILLVIIQIEKSKAATTAAAGSTSSSTPIDPQTGYPEGSAEDEAALAAINAGSTTSSGGDSGIDPSTGQTYDSEIQGESIDPSTGLSYSSELSTDSGLLSTLGTEVTSYQNQITTLINDQATDYNANNPPPAPTNTNTPKSPTASQSATLTNLQSELNKDSQGTTKGDKASVVTLQKQIAAVKARS